MKKYKLCDHLEVRKPEILKKTDVVADIRCGQCKKVWTWDKENNKYVLIFDPNEKKDNK